jgi:putative nucleotidyltransferase with HDIG domain
LSALDRFATREFLVGRDAVSGFLDLLVDRASAQLVYLYRYDETSEDLTLRSHADTKAFEHAGTVTHSCSLGEALVWADCIRERRPVLYQGYPAAAPSPLPGVDIALRNHASFPIFEGQQVVAMVGVVAREGTVDDEKLGVLNTWVQSAWPVLQERLREIAQRQSLTGASFEGQSPYDILERMVGAIAGALERREQHAAKHQQNVAHLCDLIAHEISLSESERRGLAIAASLHDIGKIAVPSAVLSKPGSVNDAEYSMLQTHAEIGADLFRPLDLPWPVVDMIAQHHERLDGSGYPGGLRRDDICEGARIIAIADTYDAIASERPYRRARTTDDALAVLLNARGQLYDAYLVDAFVRCVSADPSVGGRYRSAV